MRSALTKVPGVISADITQADGKAIVKLAKGKTTAAQLADAVTKAGFNTTAATN